MCRSCAGDYRHISFYNLLEFLKYCRVGTALASQRRFDCKSELATWKKHPRKYIDLKESC